MLQYFQYLRFARDFHPQKSLKGLGTVWRVFRCSHIGFRRRRKIRYIDFSFLYQKHGSYANKASSEGNVKRAPIYCATIKISLKLKLEDWFIFYVFTCYSLETVQWSENWYLITFNNENISAINEKIHSISWTCFLLFGDMLGMRHGIMRAQDWI